MSECGHTSKDQALGRSSHNVYNAMERLGYCLWEMVHITQMLIGQMYYIKLDNLPRFVHLENNLLIVVGTRADVALHHMFRQYIWARLC